MKFHVNLVKTVDDSYDIEIGSNLLNNLKEYLTESLQQQKRNIAIITDSNVHTIYGKNFEKIVKEETDRDEPSVIIAQRPCALLKTVKYSGNCKITDKCKNCKMCMKLGCPAITATENGIKIDPNQCNGCGLCMNVCPFGAIEKRD